MPIVNMKRKKEDDEEQVMNDNEFPWGLRIHLHNEELDKLGIKELPPVGTEIGIEAKAVIVGIDESQMINGEAEQTLTIQITDLGLFGDKGKTAADVLYGGSKET